MKIMERGEPAEKNNKPVWFRTLVLILGFISCLTIIGMIWGIPLMSYALDKNLLDYFD